MEKKNNRYEGQARPYMVLDEIEDATLDKYVADLRLKVGRKVKKSEFIKAATFYIIKNKINPID